MATQPLYPSSYSAKVAFGDELRRFSLNDVSFSALEAEIRNVFKFPPSMELGIMYKDDEQDLVTMSCESEMKTALQCVKNGVLRIVVVEKQSNPIQPLHSCFANSKKQGPIRLKDMKKIHKEQKKCFKEKRLRLRFVKEITVPEGTEFAPGTKFTKTWRLRNESEVDWPNIFLSFRKGDQLGCCDTMMQLPPVSANQEFDVTVDLVAPEEPGKYCGVWKLCGPWGRPFGEALKVKIKVFGPSSDEGEANDLKWPRLIQQLNAMGFKDQGKNVMLLNEHHGNIKKVLCKLLKEKKEMMQE